MGAKQKTLFALRAGLVACCGAVPLWACGGETTANVGQDSSQIIAGVPANGSRLNAVGSLGFVYRDPFSNEDYFSFYCSAALIGEQTILTAKHCTDFFAWDFEFGFKTVFAVGPDASVPERLFEVVDVQLAPGGMGGGLVGYGHDIAVMHLLEPVSDIAPLPFAKLEPADVGKKFVAIGYGVQSNTGRAGTRRAGPITLRALSGKLFEIMFGSFEAFKKWAESGDQPESEEASPDARRLPGVFLPTRRPYAASGVAAGEGGSGGSGGNSGVSGSAGAAEGGAGTGGGKGGEPDPDALLREIYETTLLDEGYEALLGGVRGDAQPCYGDSGSPLLAANASGQLVARGVASAVLASNQLVCDLGSIYSTFGPGVLEFLNAERDWTDPCFGESHAGHCEGAIATRCTAPGEGSRRLVEFDCSWLGQACAFQEDGTAGCSDPPEETP